MGSICKEGNVLCGQHTIYVRLFDILHYSVVVDSQLIPETRQCDLYRSSFKVFQVMKTRVLLFAFFAVLFVSLFGGWRLFVRPLGIHGEGLILDIPPGHSFYRLAEELKQRQVIPSAWDMKFLVWALGRPPLPKGEYEIKPGGSLWSLFQDIIKGKEREFLVRFPEGFNIYEMGELLKSHSWPAVEDFLHKARDGRLAERLLNQKGLSSFEGWLFPSSYLLRKYMSADTLIELMTKEFAKVYNEVSKKAGKSPYPLSNRLSRKEKVTLASLVEKETGQSGERPLIAGVFYNRMARGMKLQTDPSILYALYLARGFDIEKNIRKKDILFPSPYNTYVVRDLPPGPIANPGAKSLQAVFSPEKSDFLYFVSRNDGSHKFSKNFKEHQKAVYKYQIKPFKKR